VCERACQRVALGLVVCGGGLVRSVDLIKVLVSGSMTALHFAHIDDVPAVGPLCANGKQTERKSTKSFRDSPH